MNPGTYKARVTAAALGRTGSDTPQLGITFLPDAEGATTITAYLFFTEKALEKTEKSLQALGWDPIQNGWEIDRMLTENALLGKEAMIVLENDTYEGKTRLRVAWINDLNGGVGMKKVMAPAEAAQFTRQLQAQMRARGKLVHGAAPAPASAAGYAGDDDIPF